jgi:hypothetical protein
MTGPGNQLKGTYPPDTNFRVGTARNDGVTITVEVAGNLIANGYIDPSAAAMTDGATVLVLRFGSRWVCLGAIVNQPV